MLSTQMSFYVGVGLGQECVLPSLLLTIYVNWMDKLSRIDGCATIGFCPTLSASWRSIIKADGEVPVFWVAFTSDRKQDKNLNFQSGKANAVM